MTGTSQLDLPVAIDPSEIEPPKLLVEWASPWDEFVTAVGPALGKSPQRLAGETPVGLFPYRGMLLSWAVEIAVLLAIIFLPGKLALLHTVQPKVTPKNEVIYYSGPELPRTADAAGAARGKSGRAGGQEGFHRSQTIRVAREDRLREKVVDAPKLNLPRSDAAVANLLAYKPVPAAPPAEALHSSSLSLRAAQLAQSAIAPAPEVERDRQRVVPSLDAQISAQIIPPTVAPPRREMSSRPIPARAVEIIPPPVSAPPQIAELKSRLTLPATVPIPPPISRVPRDMERKGAGAHDLQVAVVPPPVQMDRSSLDRSHAALSGATVVPPPVQVSGASSDRNRMKGLAGETTIVPPPVQAERSSLARRDAPALGSSSGSAIVPPPPDASASSLSGSGGRSSGHSPSLDATALEPSKNSEGNRSGSGIVISSQPGAKAGLPGNSGPGSLAMSPAGTTKLGIGGTGEGTGVIHGNGPGSGLAGDSSGTSKAGTGHGADTAARSGTSPYPGTGGAGSGSATPAVPGVSVGGGNNVITLPSFAASSNPHTAPGRSSAGKSQGGPGITIVATSRSGGAMNLYGALKGDKVTTIYIDTALGTVAMQYADPASAAHPYSEDLTAPHPMQVNLPQVQRSRLVVACILDRSGVLKDVKVLEPGPTEMTTKVIAALTEWKFSPVLRGDQPIEVNAILGFNIDTR